MVRTSPHRGQARAIVPSCLAPPDPRKLGFERFHSSYRATEQVAGHAESGPTAHDAAVGAAAKPHQRLQAMGFIQPSLRAVVTAIVLVVVRAHARRLARDLGHDLLDGLAALYA